jgi:hypothetical protein
MKQTILEYLDEQIEQGTILKGTVKNRRGIDTITGALQAFEEVKEFIEKL